MSSSDEKGVVKGAVALLGGSFDPPHIAHQMLCLWALSTECAARVWFVPTYAHAFGKQLVSFEHRVQMCRLALGPFAADRVDVCTIESELGRPSRTLTTIEALRVRFPQQRFCLLVGADILAQREKWYRFAEIERLVEVVAVGRAGQPLSGAGITLPDVSSSGIRQRLRDGVDVSDLLPAAVLDYVRRHRLYGPG